MIINLTDKEVQEIQERKAEHQGELQEYASSTLSFYLTQHADLKGLSKTLAAQARADYIWLGHPNHNFATFPFLENFSYLLAVAGNLLLFMILSLFWVLHFSVF